MAAEVLKRVAGQKVVADGAIGSQAAATLTPWGRHTMPARQYGARIQLLYGDCRTVLPSAFAEDSVDLYCMSPPYNVGVSGTLRDGTWFSEAGGDNLERGAYMERMLTVFGGIRQPFVLLRWMRIGLSVMANNLVIDSHHYLENHRRNKDDEQSNKQRFDPFSNAKGCCYTSTCTAS